MPRPPSAPSNVIALVYVILEIMWSKNKHKLCLKASILLAGVTLSVMLVAF